MISLSLCVVGYFVSGRLISWSSSIFYRFGNKWVSGWVERKGGKGEDCIMLGRPISIRLLRANPMRQTGSDTDFNGTR